MKIATSVIGIVLITLLTSCQTLLNKELPPRPPLPEGTPDLTKGEGPVVQKAKKDWFLHCGGTHGWIYRDENDKCNKARQILVTKVPFISPLRRKLKVGDVILGVNGKYFDKQAVFQFRKAAKPVQDAEGKLDVILWRKGWDKERVVTLDFTPKKLDFTRGDKPGLAVDWNLGPTGARGWVQGKLFESVMARQILITSVEKGSPADGILQKGDVILGVEGEKFNSDARRALAEAITRAETEENKGRLHVLRWRPSTGLRTCDGKTEDVVIPLKVMGSYSKTTPWNCPKSEKILNEACDYLITKDILGKKNMLSHQSIAAALALMSTGEPKHLEIVKKHIAKFVKIVDNSGPFPPVACYASWDWSYANLMLCEYYLLTGDKKVLPAIRKYSDCIAKGQSGAGCWGHRMATSNHGECHGYGALNQAGITCWISLILAKRCGVTNPEIEQAISRGSEFFKTFVGIQAVPYGDCPDIIPKYGHDDNGKCSAVVLGYSMLGDKKTADYYARMTIASYAVRERGHTGNWWSFLWGSLGAARTGPKACGAFLNKINWLFDLERRWDGGFAYQGKAGIGYGINRNGGQKTGAEHTTPFWDTTGARILMYTLPRKKLCITGKDIMTVDIPEKEIPEIIEAGRPPVEGINAFPQRYDNRSVPELMDLLGNWSPVVRYHAALSLAKKEEAHTEELIKMLKSDNKYARYGAAMALMQMGPKASDAVPQLIKMLDSDDSLLLSFVISALGNIGDKRAIKPLLKLGAKDLPNDPIDINKRFIVKALFNKKGLLGESIDGVDRKLLFPAVRSFLKCQGGMERSLVARNVIKKLKFEELKPLWPDLIPAMLECAPAGVMFASEVRETIASILAENKVEEGMELIFEYLKEQKQHGAGKRNKLITDLLKQYGAAAKPMIPKMEEYVEFLKIDRPWIDTGQPPVDRFYKGQIPYLKETIKAIKKSKEKPKLKSISPYLK